MTQKQIQPSWTCYPRISKAVLIWKSSKSVLLNGSIEKVMLQKNKHRKSYQLALESVDIDAPDWTFVAARELLNTMYRDAQKNRGYEGRTMDLSYKLIQKVSQQHEGQRYPVYKAELLDSYTKTEIEELGSVIDPEKDKLFSYIGIYLLNDRYLARPKKDKVYELPQERFMIIAMEIIRLEKTEHRLQLVKEAYWAMSNLYMTVATPTLSNAGKDTRAIELMLHRCNRGFHRRNLSIKL